MKQATQKQKDDFGERFNKLYKECVEQGYIPMPTLGMNRRSIYAYIDIVGISKKEAKELLKIK